MSISQIDTIKDGPSTKADKTSSYPAQERRSRFPGMDAHRRLFAKIEGIIRRYSFNPAEKDANGNYVTSIEKVRTVLSQELKELNNIDTLIPLLRLIRISEWDIESGDKRIGTYRLMSPTVKELNDYYLGANQTDDFINELQQGVQKILGQNGAVGLKTFFKGGSFIIDMDQLKDGQNDDKSQVIEIFKAKAIEINEFAQTILLNHLERRQRTLSQKHADASFERCRINDEPNTNGNGKTGKKERIQTVSDEIDVLDKNIKETSKLIDDIESGRRNVSISIGLDKLSGNLLNIYRSIRNSEVAANIASLKPDELSDKTQECEVKEYSDKEQIKVLLKARIKLQKTVLSPDGQSILPEWRNFFTLKTKKKVELIDGVSTPGEELVIEMNEEMIDIYRHLDKHLTSEAYSNLGDKEKHEFHERMPFFEEYYRAINTIDYLKNFQTKDIKRYFNYINEVINLIDTAESYLATETLSAEQEAALRQTLEETSKILEISPKNRNQVGARIQTTRAAIKAMMVPGLKLRIYGDVMSFGRYNQNAYEKWVTSMLKFLGLDEMNLVEADEETIDKSADTAIEKQKDQLAFQLSMLSSDDIGSARIREIETKFSSLFDGNPVQNVDGGDELMQIITEEPGNTPLSERTQHLQPKVLLEPRLLEAGTNNSTRVVYRINDFTLPPIIDELQQAHRDAILCLIDEKTAAEDGTTKVKSLNATGLNRALPI